MYNVWIDKEYYTQMKQTYFMPFKRFQLPFHFQLNTVLQTATTDRTLRGGQHYTKAARVVAELFPHPIQHSHHCSSLLALKLEPNSQSCKSSYSPRKQPNSSSSMSLHGHVGLHIKNFLLRLFAVNPTTAHSATSSGVRRQRQCST